MLQPCLWIIKNYCVCNVSGMTMRFKIDCCEIIELEATHFYPRIVHKENIGIFPCMEDYFTMLNLLREYPYTIFLGSELQHKVYGNILTTPAVLPNDYRYYDIESLHNPLI